MSTILGGPVIILRCFGFWDQTTSESSQEDDVIGSTEMITNMSCWFFLVVTTGIGATFNYFRYEPNLYMCLLMILSPVTLEKIRIKQHGSELSIIYSDGHLLYALLLLY